MRWWMLLGMLAGCETEEAQEASNEECTPTAAAYGCDHGYATCCTGTDDGSLTACWYELDDGTRFDCAAPLDCTSAATELVCATCPATTGC